ncbi:MAG: PorV/PorQ family protein [Melioribacteraceae bacterium]
MIKILIVLLLLLFSSTIVGQGGVTKTGTTAAKFLSIGVGPRANAMGGAYSAVANDASSMYWNPSGIAFVEKFQGIFTYTQMFADVNLNYFGIVIPTGEMGNIGISVTALNIGEMDVTTELRPEGTGETFSSGSYAFGLSYAKFITDNFIFGATFKYIKEDIFNSSAEGIAFDIGTIFHTPFYGVKFASSITNFGTKMNITGDDLIIRYDQDPTTRGNNETVDAKLSTDFFELPLRLQIGLSKDFIFAEGQRLTIATDANYPNDNNQWVNVGGELALFHELVSLRAGYKAIFLDESQEGLTFGFGLKYDQSNSLAIQVDYAFQKLEYLDNTHSFGIMLSF